MVYITFSERIAEALVNAGAVATVVSKSTLDTTVRSLMDEEVVILAGGSTLGHAIRALSLHPRARILVPITETIQSSRVRRVAKRVELPGLGSVPVWELTLAGADPDGERDPWDSVVRSQKRTK